MGLDVSHGCWAGSCSAFCRWRQAIALAAGYLVMPVKYDDGILADTIMIDWGHLPGGALQGEWDETPCDPLLVIIAHSDCGGVIHVSQAGPLADRLEELLPTLKILDDKEPQGGHLARLGLAGATRRWINGLRKAVAANETVVFS